MLDLDSDSVISRIEASDEKVALPNLKQSIIVGAIGFTIVSVLLFGIWAGAGRWMYQNLGATLFYSLLGVGFMAGGGGAFKPVLIGNNLGRFYALFVGAFFVYAAVWMACWFTIREVGEWVASGLGPALMAMIFTWAFRANEQMWRCVTAMVAGHTLGYFIGEWLFYWEPLQNRYGMLLWGVTYGVGFGAGIAATLYWCQTETRGKLKDLSSATPAVDSSS